MAKTLHPKVKGKSVGHFHGFTVYARLDAAKKKGKDRVWFFIRPNDLEAWRVASNMAWARGVDAGFESVPSAR